TVFDAEAQLVQLLVHLNRSRFPHLLGYADIVRLVRGEPDLDWDAVGRLAEAAGVATPVALTLETVYRALGLRAPHPLPTRAADSLAWRAMFRPSRFLRGDLVTSIRHPRTSYWLATLVRGQRPATARYLLRRALPTRTVAAVDYPEQADRPA